MPESKTGVRYFGRGDVIWYRREDECDIRKMLEHEFGAVCKEHGGEGEKAGEVWGWWSYSKGGTILPCFVHGALDRYRRLPLLFTSEMQEGMIAGDSSEYGA